MTVIFLEALRILFASLVLLTAAFTSHAEENVVLFRDDFNHQSLNAAPSTDLWTMVPSDQDQQKAFIGGIGDDATPNWCTLAGQGQFGVRSRAFAPQRQAWAHVSVRMEGGRSCHISLCDAQGNFPFELQLIQGEGNTYDAVILCHDAAGKALRQTIARNMPPGQWHQWTLGIKLIDTRGYYWIYRDGRSLADSVLAHSVTQIPSMDHLQIMADNSRCSFSDTVVSQRSPVANQTKRNPEAYIEPHNFEKVAYDLQVAPDGGLSIQLGRTTYSVHSAFSRVGGGMLWIGWPAQTEAKDQKWPVRIEKLSQQAYRITADNDHYRLVRKIERFPNHIAVSDQLTNKTDRLLGIRFLNVASSTAAQGSSRIGGAMAPSQFSLNAPDRPFIQLLTPNNSLGMITRDDVYQNQAFCYSDALGYGIRDDYFALAPRASYTVRWELYPVATTSPFDFMNTVRSVWKTNRLTIPGIYAFVYPWRQWAGNGKRLDQMSVADMKKWLQITGIDTIAFILNPDPGGPGAEATQDPAFHRPWLQVEAFGEDYYRVDSSKIYWKEITGRLRQARSDIQLLPYFFSEANPLDARFNDARILFRNGKQKSWFFRQRYTIYGYYGTPTNSFGRAIEKVFDSLHKEFGQDGIYWDGFGQGSDPLWMFHTPDWDGHSALIDHSTNQVIEKMTSLCLITQPLRTKLANKVLSRGQAFWTNWQPTTQADIALNVPHFIEWFRPQEAARGYLSSPISLGGHEAKTQADVIGRIHKFLEYGLLYQHIAGGAYAETSPSILQYFYPITPIELGAGYIVGKERIVVARSGRFGFGEDGPLYAIVYGADGLRKADASKNITRDGKTYCELSLLPGEVAVVLRKN